MKLSQCLLYNMVGMATTLLNRSVTNLSSFLSNSFGMNNSQSMSDLYSIPAMATTFSHCFLKRTGNSWCVEYIL